MSWRSAKHGWRSSGLILPLSALGQDELLPLPVQVETDGLCAVNTSDELAYGRPHPHVYTNDVMYMVYIYTRYKCGPSFDSKLG